MLKEALRKKVKRYFWWEDKIKAEVKMTKAELEARRHAKNRVGIDDPTGSFVARKNSKLKVIKIYVNGKRVIIEKPEDWLEVVKKTYDLYSRQPIASVVRERIETEKSVEVLSGFMGVSKETYHRWENEFFDDAVLIASNAGLFQENKNAKKQKVLHIP